MKITESQLRRIVREEIGRLTEATDFAAMTPEERRQLWFHGAATDPRRMELNAWRMAHRVKDFGSMSPLDKEAMQAVPKHPQYDEYQEWKRPADLAAMRRNDSAVKFAYAAKRALGSFSSALDFTGEVIEVGPAAACHAYPEAKRLCARTPADLLADPEWLELVIGVLNDTDLD